MIGSQTIEIYDSSLVPVLQKIYHISDPKVIPFYMTTQNYLKNIQYYQIGIEFQLKENHGMDHFAIEYDEYPLNDDPYYNLNTYQNYIISIVQKDWSEHSFIAQPYRIPLLFNGTITHIIIKTKATLNPYITLECYVDSSKKHFKIEQIPLADKYNDHYVYQLASQPTNAFLAHRIDETFLIIDDCQDLDSSDLQIYAIYCNIFSDMNGVSGLTQVI